MVATRRTIQHEYLRLLNEAAAKGEFHFRRGEREPYGIQADVRRAVNQQFYGPTRMKTNKQQVSDWVRRVRENDYEVTRCEQDYSKSSQNSRIFFEPEKKRIRDFIREEKLKCTDIASVWKDKRKDMGRRMCEDRGKQVQVSASTARRFLKEPLGDEPSHVAARPKGMRVGGQTAHHNKARLTEAKYWKSQPQEVINGIVFGDESKMRMKEGRNKMIDIEWCFRGDASETNWYEDPRHTTQINLFLVQSIDGILFYELYNRNMKKAHYIEKLPQIKETIDESGLDFKVWMHDNAWRGAQPTGVLDEVFGEGRYTKYMGTPCKKDSDTMRTPVTDRPCKVPKKRCGCKFPTGPIHASYAEESPLT